MRRLLPILIAFALLTLSTAAQAVPSAPAQQASSATTITAVLEGGRTAVFSTPQDSCSADDIPDAMARAFRDDTGTIHFISASSVTYQSLGPTLDTLQHSCEAAFVSANDADPAAYNDQVWLDSFYTLDGRNVAALSHTEYHGWSHPGECTITNPNNYFYCEYDSDTYHRSSDGGYHFNGFKAPGNLVAGVPEKYQIDRGPLGTVWIPISSTSVAGITLSLLTGLGLETVPVRRDRAIASCHSAALPFAPPTFLTPHHGAAGMAPISPCRSSTLTVARCPTHRGTSIPRLSGCNS